MIGKAKSCIGGSALANYVIKENTDFTNNKNNFILFVKSFQLYLFARVKSKEVVDNFTPIIFPIL